MAKKVIQIPLHSGSNASILIETNESEQLYGSTEVSLGDSIIERVETSFDKALGIIVPASEMILSQIKKLSESPSSVSVEYGIKFNIKGDAIIASSEAEANYKVTLSWIK